MNAPRFDRFAQPDYLQRIGRERVTQVLSPFAPELLGLGIALPAAALPDELFFQVLATLAGRTEGLSVALLDAMTAIEVLDEIFPDERAPLVVTELRFRLRPSARPILLTPAAGNGLLDGGMDGLVADGSLELVTEPGVKEAVPSLELLAELREQRILLAKLNAQVGSLAKELPARAEGQSPGPVNEAGAVAVFALIVKLDAQGKQKAPSPLTVFRHYCIEGLSAEQVATKCRCAKGTVMGRLRLIERATRKKPESFRAMSDHLQRLDDTYSNTSARDIYRRGLADGELPPDGTNRTDVTNDGAHGVTRPTETIFRRDAEKDSRDGCATNNQTEQPKQQEQ